MTKFAFYTLGCKSNQYETNQMKLQVEQAGFKIVSFHEPADFYIINTCTLTQNADRKSRHSIRQTKHQNPRAKIIVTGCYPEVDDLNSITEIDLIINNRDKHRFVDKLREEGLIKTQNQKAIIKTDQRVRAFLMIENGCPNSCSYCIVPAARGKQVESKSIDQVLREAKALIRRGAREIILTGINLGAYQFNLAELLKSLSELENLRRIRLSSIEPMFLTKELIHAVAETPKVCPHLHIPLQSGDEEILKAMNRPYTPTEYLETANYAKKKIPELGLNTDIIVGFPGETEEQFNNTIKLVKKIKFSRLHIFSYSPRKGTPAAELSNQIDPQTKQKRYAELAKLRDKYMLGFARKYKNKKVEILVESGKEDYLEGLTPNYIRVKCTARVYPLPTRLLGQLITLTYHDHGWR